MTLGPLRIPTPLQQNKELYLKEITFILWENTHKNIKCTKNRDRLLTVESKYGNYVTATIIMYIVRKGIA